MFFKIFLIIYFLPFFPGQSSFRKYHSFSGNSHNNLISRKKKCYCACLNVQYDILFSPSKFTFHFLFYAKKHFLLKVVPCNRQWFNNDLVIFLYFSSHVSLFQYSFHLLHVPGVKAEPSRVSILLNAAGVCGVAVLLAELQNEM